MFEPIHSSFDDIFDFFGNQNYYNPYMIVVRKCAPKQKRQFRQQQQQEKQEKLTNANPETKDNAYTIKLDVHDFAPEEITVKIIGDNMISIEAKHEEKEDEHGFVYRHFVKKYTLPKGYDINNITSKLSTDGQLAITAPKTENLEIQSKVIKIEQTGLPASTIGDMVTPKQPTTVGKDIIDESVETAGKDLPN